MNRRSLWIFFVLGLIITASGCAKNEWSINGKGEPQIEIQKCIKLSEDKNYEEAVECLEIFKSKFPRTKYSLEAELYIADNQFDQKEYLLAADTYNTYVRMHPTGPKLDYAYYRTGLSYLKETPKAYDRDQQYLDDAVKYLRASVAAFPDSPYKDAAVESLKEARLRMAKRIYYIGRFYYRFGEYKAAIPRFVDLINDYPETDLVPITFYKLIVAAAKLNEIDEAKLYYTKMSMDFPNDKWTKKAEKKLAKFTEGDKK